MEITLEVSRLTDQAYNIIKEKIISKELAPGTRLVDSQLAAKFGISRTPLRDAIRKLNEDGLVTSCGGRGYAVFQPSTKDIEEIFEIRLAVDIAAATKLIAEILPNDPEVRKVFEQFYAFFTNNGEFEDDGDSFVRVDEDFHDKMIMLMNNTRLYNFYAEIRNQTRTIRRKSSGNKARMAKAFNHHEKICRALLDLDLEATTKYLKEHIELSRIDALSDVE